MADILAERGEGMRVSRPAPLAAVLVLDFPSLAAQAAALNRVAALTEKRGLARDRVVRPAELEAYLARTGGEAASFYHGHNYPSEALARFFRLAERAGAGLGDAERKLRRLLREHGAIRATPEGYRAGARIAYVVTFARVDGPDAEALRAAVLGHELGHAFHARRPAYRAFVARFWREALTAGERVAFERFLRRRDYALAQAELVRTEFQAFLAFTPFGRIIDDTALGLPAGALAELRARFEAAMPEALRREVVALREAVRPERPAAGARPPHEPR
ncbi:MAG: hypothetical protein GVY33_11080 [Alphaproteobacteria bacterium]|nr:hypothetical protein [Alphaproteobacteria bacterium]